jgi:hypothetical protein
VESVDRVPWVPRGRKGVSIVVAACVLGLLPGSAVATAAPSFVAWTLDDPASAAMGWLGYGVAALNDQDLDGVGDFVVSSPHEGLVHVYSGADHTILRTLTDPGPLEGTQCAPTDESGSPCSFGWDVVNAGDWNGDGRDDVAVAAPGPTDPYTIALPCNIDPSEPEAPCPQLGRTFILSASSGAVLREFPDWPAKWIVMLGDVNTDGTPDIALGGASSFWMVRAFSGADGALLWSTHEPGQYGFALHLERLPDLNGDGRAEILLGDPFHDPTPDSSGDDFGQGLAYVVSGLDGTRLRTHTSPAPTKEGGFGGRVANAGDQDGDGLDDYVIAEPGTAESASASLLHLFSGASGALVATVEAPIDGRGIDNQMGQLSIARVDDIDEDGRPDFWLGSFNTAAVALTNRFGAELAAKAASDPLGAFGWEIAAIDAIVPGPSQDVVIGAPRESGAGFSEAGTATVLRRNLLPELTIDLIAVAADEGSVATNSGTVMDPDGGPVALEASIGNVVVDASGDWTWTFEAEDGPGQSQTVALTATDDEGGATVASFALVVDNLPPILDGLVASPTPPVRLGDSVTVTSSFIDPGILDTHVGSVDWNDGTIDAATISESGGSGELAGTHVFGSAGLFDVVATVRDKDLATATATYPELVVFDPSRSVTSNGHLPSPAGADAASPASSGTLHFTLNSKYAKDANVPGGLFTTTIHVGGLSFQATGYEFLVVEDPPRARLQGTGLVDGSIACRFRADLYDGSWAGHDAFGLRIFDCAQGPSERFLLPPTSLASGNVVIH